MSDDDGLEVSPWYIRFLLRVGVPTAFASVLLWFLISNVTGTLGEVRAAQAMLMENQTRVLESQMQLLRVLQDHERVSTITSMLLSAMCMNGAASDAERDRCAEAFRQP